jgi:hypothetical protein
VPERGQKSDHDRRDTLIQELRTLRKGAGLTLRRLSQALTLRAVVAERLNKLPADVTLSQVHTALIEELNQLGEGIEARATRNALAIGHRGDPQNITTRRSDFALKYSRHSDTVEAYENHGIEEIADRLLGSLRSMPSAANATDYDSINDDDPQQRRASTDAREMVSAGLQLLYPFPSHAKDMIKAFGRAQNPFVDVNIEWRLLPSDRGQDWYSYNFKYTFRAAKNRYLIGVVSSTHDCEVLMSSGIVDDVMVLSADTDYDQEIASIQHSCRFVIRDQSSGTQQALSFALINDESKQSLLQSAWPIDMESCQLLQVELPEPSNYEDVVCEYLMSLELRVNEHYCFWWAPRLMHINNITVDVSHFPNRHDWRFFIQPFLGTLLPGGMEPTGDRYTLPAGEWIMPGHGIAIIWQETS